MPAASDIPPSREIPERFRVAKRTLWFDRFMTVTIIGGGLLVIASVLGIFLFIFAETIPLFSGAAVKEQKQAAGNVTHLDTLPDLKKDWAYLKSDGQALYFFNTASGETAVLPVPMKDDERITTASADLHASLIAIGTDKGNVALIGKDQPTEGDIKLTPASESKPSPINELSIAAGEKRTVILASGSKEHPVNLVTWEKMSALGEETSITRQQIDAAPPVTQASLNAEGEGLILVSENKNIVYYRYDEDEEEWTLAQTIPSPLNGESISAACWIFGGSSVLLGGEKGTLCLLSVYPQKNSRGRNDHLLGETKRFEPMQGAVRYLVPSLVNRSFFAATDKELKLCYSTTGATRWSEEIPGYVPLHLSVDEPFRHLVVLDEQGKIHRYAIDDKHPEAGLKAFFGNIWYEGYTAPDWQWQSVGGSDSYEPKLSLMPLIFGTLKGTLYALLFAVPVALLAAVYTAHFMAPKMKRIVKPTMEIMASLPSVVLGFFGALYIAPLMEDKVPALVCMIILIPAAAIGLGAFWARRPVAVRNKYGRGIEYLVLTPVVLLIGWASWHYLGTWLEPLLINIAGLATGTGSDGHAIHSFADLWRNGLGLSYEQRNSLVVGFIMGFAVIPVIFTIAEDALSNVPPSLINASEALGASRWQVVRTIVLPIAAAGIFSALMIGIGRAVGETMIVLMATGNTPVMDWNIFNGMRTLSANIATELPEAAVHSTHYRVLFLCAFLLFIMTFALNTIAEFLRNRLRERYKVI